MAEIVVCPGCGHSRSVRVLAGARFTVCDECVKPGSLVRFDGSQARVEHEFEPGEIEAAADAVLLAAGEDADRPWGVDPVYDEMIREVQLRTGADVHE